MKKKKRLFAAMLILSLTLGGCGGCNKTEPVENPTATVAPTTEPTKAEVLPTEAPVAEPTAEPTEAPTEVPTVEPTIEPTAVPTEAPMDEPEVPPTEAPTPTPEMEIVIATSTPVPTVTPTTVPTEVPAEEEPTVAPTATPKPTATPTPTPATVKGVKAGDYITFGNYEQDNNLDNGKEPIEWLVLEVKDGKAFLLSKYGLDGQVYYHKAWMSEDPEEPNFDVKANVTWETSDLRAWLSTEFLNNAFTEKEQDSIVLTKVKNPDHYRGTDGGNDTKDKVYVLSVEEADKYFGEILYIWPTKKPEKSEHILTATDYTNSIGVGVRKDSPQWYHAYASWWLRTPGQGTNYAAFIDATGTIAEDGFLVHSRIAVRPCMWLDLTTADFEKAN